MLQEGAPLYEQAKRGEFKLSGPKEIFQEARLLVQNLELDCLIYSHGSNYLLLQGKLPEDKQALLDTIDAVFTKEGERALKGAGILQDEWDRAI